MRTMEEGVVNDHDFESAGGGDKEMDFGNYIQDEDETVATDYAGEYFEDTYPALVRNKKDQPRRDSNPVGALVRHFKIFFPKVKRPKTYVEVQPEKTSGGLRGFSFTDSKIGKDFEHFTMGHCMDFYPFATEYLEDNSPTHDTAPPFHVSRRSKIIGEESIFKADAFPSDETENLDDDAFAEKLSHPVISGDEEQFSSAPDEFDPGTNEYLFPDGPTESKVEEGNCYANVSLLEEPHLTAEQNYSGMDEHPVTTGSFDNDVVSEIMETEYDRHSLENQSIQNPRESVSTTEEFDDPRPYSKHKSLPSLFDSPPQPPPLDPNRPAFHEESMKIYRNNDASTNIDSSTSQKSKPSNIFDKALRRISSYFSLKKENAWKVDPDEGVELKHF